MYQPNNTAPGGMRYAPAPKPAPGPGEPNPIAPAAVNQHPPSGRSAVAVTPKRKGKW